ncbi:endonuclease/exonuclease/phosphatase family protein [Sphingobacterium shayense]|uniref:endonuclease/exonuclease/phosphatase family protein n=1 Tax=Sphingobacterium shayense TaxID=626343 RepID=UPI0015530566|nr:endonuclease/exonuclease/phosphatase family protein [Sphingobacterium shayense]NQD72570.1 endonuclease/exonuclease/phosphatase family protein [Sphingobacterium shayense]
MFEKYKSSRRVFIKHAGLLSGLPLVGKLDIVRSDDVIKSRAIRVLTCNIRVDLPEDAQKNLGWIDRREACIAVIKKQKADIIGFQEVLKGQFLDLKAALKEYHGFGFDGPEMDEYTEGYHGIAKNPVFFARDRFELLTAGNYWLSQTPLKAGSISWGSARARNACWVRLLDRHTGREFRLSNLHLDHVNNTAKRKQAAVVLEDAAQYQNDFAQILTGDFNVAMDSEVYSDILAAGWKDSFVQANGTGTPEGTVHGFKGEAYERKDKAKKIDFIFVKGPLKGTHSVIIKDTFKGVLPSDHYFVLAEIAAL